MTHQVERACRAARTGLRRLTFATLRAAGTELAWIAAHTALYPTGVLAERVTSEPPRRRSDAAPTHPGELPAAGSEAVDTPILLVHGMIDNRSVFLVLRRGLHRSGFGRVRTVNYSPLLSDVRTAARDLERSVEALCAQTGYQRIHVIAHSLGGMIGRYYVQRLGGDARVHTLVTLGTPHGGTHTARLLPLNLCRQLRPGSDLLVELAAEAPNCRTRFVAVGSDLDQIVVPSRNALIHHPDLVARNVLLRGIGHMSLPINGQVVQEVVQALAHLHPDGSTATPAVTSLQPRISGERRPPGPDGAGQPARWQRAAAGDAAARSGPGRDTCSEDTG